MLLGTLDVSPLRNLLSGKRETRAGNGLISGAILVIIFRTLQCLSTSPILQK